MLSSFVAGVDSCPVIVDMDRFYFLMLMLNSDQALFSFQRYPHRVFIINRLYGDEFSHLMFRRRPQILYITVLAAAI